MVVPRGTIRKENKKEMLNFCNQICRVLYYCLNIDISESMTGVGGL